MDDRTSPVTMEVAEVGERPPTAAPEVNRRRRRKTDAEEPAAPGWLARFGNANLVISVLGGGFGLIAALVGVWQWVDAGPKIHLTLSGDNIEVRWSSAGRRVSFDCWFMAKNDGQTADTLTVKRAHLITAKGATLMLRDIAVKNSSNGEPVHSFGLKQEDPPLDLLLSASLPLDDRSEPLFRETGLHVLVLDFEGPVSRTKKSLTTCFWFGEQALLDLVQNGSVPTGRDDSRCMGESGSPRS